MTNLATLLKSSSCPSEVFREVHITQFCVHIVNYTASSFKLKVINFTPYYMQGVQKNQKIGNERLAGALSGTRELTDLISSVIYEISTNSFEKSIKQHSQKEKKGKKKIWH